MINININPIIFTIGGFSLHWYGVIVLIAVIVALGWTLRAARRESIPQDIVVTTALWAIPGGIIGSRLVHVIDQLDYYLANPGAIIGGEGQAIYGAVLGGMLTAWLGSKIHQLPFPKIADMAVPGVVLAQAVGRIANIINGDAHGAPTSLPWAFVYNHPNTYAPIGVPGHPAPVYELLWDIVIFGLLLKLRGRLQPPGSLLIFYLALYSLGRFFINFTRVNEPFLGGLHQAQVIALIILAVTLPLLALRTRYV
jgi:phosphatidylglycerol:prolipoprotein diacylglycerol transferase